MIGHHSAGHDQRGEKHPKSLSHPIAPRAHSHDKEEWLRPIQQRFLEEFHRRLANEKTFKKFCRVLPKRLLSVECFFVRSFCRRTGAASELRGGHGTPCSHRSELLPCTVL